MQHNDLIEIATDLLEIHRKLNNKFQSRESAVIFTAAQLLIQTSFILNENKALTIEIDQLRIIIKNLAHAIVHDP